MKILYVVSRPFTINTSASIRNLATILGLKSLGHEVDIVTTKADKNHPAYDPSMLLSDLNVKEIKLTGIQSIIKYGRRLKFLDPLRVCLYRRFAKQEIYDNLKGIINHTKEIDLKSGNYDMIVSSSDPKSSHLFVLKLLKENPDYKGKWIQIWGDPFLSDITNQTDKSKKIREEEKKLIAPADKIVYVSRLTLLDQQKRYSSYSYKMTYQPVPYIEPTIYPVNHLRGKDILELVYCGDYNSSIRNIEPLVNAVNKSKGIHLTICGNSDKTVQSSDNISVYGRVDYSKVKKLEKNADVLIHLSNLSGTQIPGKIYHYSSTNKPILFILDGDKEGLLGQFEKYDRYKFCNNDSTDIALSIQQMIDEDYQYKPVELFSNLEVCSKILQ